MSLIVYLSGPYTKPDPVHNTSIIIALADQLLTLGFIPIVPHLTLFWHYNHPRPYEDWMWYDFGLIRCVDVLLRVPGYSPGADREVDEANRLKKPVCYGWIVSLTRWCDDRSCMPTPMHSAMTMALPDSEGGEI